MFEIGFDIEGMPERQFQHKRTLTVCQHEESRCPCLIRLTSIKTVTWRDYPDVHVLAILRAEEVRLKSDLAKMQEAIVAPAGAGIHGRV